MCFFILTSSFFILSYFLFPLPPEIVYPSVTFIPIQTKSLKIYKNIMLLTNYMVYYYWIEMSDKALLYLYVSIPPAGAGSPK